MIKTIISLSKSVDVDVYMLPFVENFIEAVKLVLALSVSVFQDSSRKH